MFGSETLMKLMVELGISGAKEVKAGLDDVSKSAETTDDNLVKVGGTNSRGTGGGSGWAAAAAIGAIAGVVATIGNKLFTLAEDAGKFAANINTLSEKTGVATGPLQELLYILDRKDVSSSSLVSAFAALNKNIVESPEKIEKLGVKTRDANGNLRTTSDIFNDLLPQLATFKSDAGQSAAAQDLFGRTGKDLIPLLSEGAAGIATLRDRYKDLGIQLSEDTIKKGNEFNDLVKDTKDQVNFLGLDIGNSLIPAFTSLVTFISENLIPIWDILKSAMFDVLVTGAASTFAIFKESLKGMYNFVAGTFTLDWQQVWLGIKQLTLAPIEAIKTGVLGLAEFFKTIWEKYQEPVKQAFNSFINVFKNGFTTFSLWIEDYIINPVTRAINKIRELAGLPPIKPPDLGHGTEPPTEPQPIKPTPPKNPVPSPKPGPGQDNPIPMATGGIVNSPTHILAGEAGPEAIVPLNNRILQNIGQNVSGFINMLGSTASSAYDYTEAGYQPISQNNATVYGQGNIGGGQGSQLKSRAQMRLDAFNEGRIFIDSRDANELEKSLDYMARNKGKPGAEGEVMSRLQGTLQRAGYPEDMAKYLSAQAAQRTGYNVTVNNYSPTPLSAQQITENFKAQMAVMGLNA